MCIRDRSSATLRNEMAALTKLGLLEQPHTSAGRVPSAQGYRSVSYTHLPPHPKTNPTLDEILAAEAAMPGLAALEAEAAENVEKIYIRMGDDELL